MAKCRPSKWVVPWALLGAGLPWLAAAWISGGSLKAEIAARASSALAGNEATAWAKVESDGRDFIVTGTSPSQEAAEAAVKAVAGTYGVRTAMASPQLKIEPPQPVAEVPAAPAVPAAPPLMPATVPAGAKWPFAVTGTWPESPGATLKATIGPRSYELGRGAALTSDGKGNFTFAPAAKLSPGTYDITFVTTDAAGKTATAALPGVVVIPEPAAAAPPVPAETPGPAVEPAAAAQPVPMPVPIPVPIPVPTVQKQLDLTGLPIIRGTFPNAAGVNLSVGLGSKTYVLGKDANLTAKDGLWSLIPSQGLKDGIYDVVVTATDASGASAKDEGVAELEVDAVLPDAPALTAFSGDASPATIAGTWAENSATGLKVSIPAAKLSGELGAPASPLTSDGGGNWSLALPAPLPPGTYDVEIASTDVHGRIQATTAAGGIVISAAQPAPEPPAAPEPQPAPPAPPAIGLYVQPPAADAVWPFALTGRWSEGTALNLKARLGGRTYELGKGAALTSNGGGVFTFAPRAASLEPGSHTVWFTSKGPAGDIRVASASIVVPEKMPPVDAAEPAEPGEPVAAAQPPQPVVPERVFDCVGTLNTLNKVFPVRFGFDRSKLEGIAALALSQYAALLKDPRCAALKVEIGGHADYFGPASYNLGLSERRAATVLEALRQAGVADSSLLTKGYGEGNPLDPSRTDAAREKNRRVEFTASK